MEMEFALTVASNSLRPICLVLHKNRKEMKPEVFFRKIFSLRLWLNLAAMMITVVALCWGVKIGIDVYTHHGEKIIIPDVRHKDFADAEHLLENSGLKIVVSDTGYVKTLPADCILEQSPEPGRGVKSGRVVYVVINSSSSPTLTIPDVIDNCSYREARAKLLAMGFKVGAPEYVSGEKDWIYGLKSKGRMLQNGQKVSVNDIIIIQVGDGMRDLDDSVIYEDPSLYGGYGDSTLTEVPVYEEYGGTHGAPADVDDFEPVTGPE